MYYNLYSAVVGTQIPPPDIPHPIPDIPSFPLRAAPPPPPPAHKRGAFPIYLSGPARAGAGPLYKDTTPHDHRITIPEHHPVLQSWWQR